MVAFEVPAAWEGWTEEERLLWCGRELRKTLREMFDDCGIGLKMTFEDWLADAPLPERGRQAIELARQIDGG